LEIADEADKCEEMPDKDSELQVEQTQHAGSTECTRSGKLPMRQAAVTVRKQINRLLENNALTILFVIE